MNRIYFGRSVLSRKKISIPIEELAKTHTHVLGRSGAGKSKLLERMARDIIKAKYGLIVLDGKGDLYDSLLRFCTLLRMSADRLVVVDPDDSFCPGLNFLECLGGTDPDTQAGIVIDALKKMHKDEETRHWLEEWGRTVLSTLSAARFTLTEIFPFARADDPRFRHVVLKKVNQPYLVQKWKEFEGTFRKLEKQAEVLQVIKTRGDIFRQSVFLCGMFGQNKTTIDWKGVMDRGGVVLAQLGQGNIDPKGLSFVGTAMIHQIVRIAQTRPKGARRPCFVIIDEFQRFLTPDLADGLDRLRGFGVYFILSHQNLAQLSEEEPKIYASVMSNCRNKITFTISREDSETMYGELFAGQIYPAMQQIKDEISQTKFRPIKTWIDLYSETESETESHGESSFSGEMEGGSDISSIMYSYGSDGEMNPSYGTSEGTARTSGTTRGSGTIDTVSQGTARHHACVPWYDYAEFEEVSGRTFYSEAEVKERFIAWINTQDDRHYQLKVGNRKPIPMVAPFIEDVLVRDKDVAALKEKVYNKIARLADDVRREVEGRVSLYLEQTANQLTINDEEYDEGDLNFREPKKPRKE